MKIKIFVVLVFFVFLHNVSLAQSIIAGDTLAHNLYRHTAYLGADRLEGRGTGSRGLQTAANYIAQFFQQMDLKPAFHDTSYFQPVPMHGSLAKDESLFCIFTANDTLTQKLNKDYLLYKSGAQTFIPAPVELVFTGYGITAPEFDYDDYQTVDVEGKIAVFLEDEPFSDDPEYFEGSSPTIHSYAESKQRIALAHGAIGSIMIANKCDSASWQKRVRSFAFEDVTLAYRVSGHFGILLHPQAAMQLFENSPHNLDDLYQLADKHAIYSFPLSTRIIFRGLFKERDFISNNVAAFIKGKSDYTVIISAHYDHLGIGIPVDGDSIYNGVMDNAMGTAAVLELASMFKSNNSKPRNNILFLLVTGEENGLLGSTYYTDNPVFPLYKTIANVNIDGLAAFDLFTEIIGVGAEFSDLGTILKRVVKKNNFTYGIIPPQFLVYESFSRSDQMAFSWAGIPSILVLDGLQYQSISAAAGLEKWLYWNERIYHTPADDINQPINWQAAAMHTQFLYAYIKELANLKHPPQWRYGLPFKNIRLQTIAEKR